jgi:hypothetical protein
MFYKIENILPNNFLLEPIIASSDVGTQSVAGVAALRSLVATAAVAQPTWPRTVAVGGSTTPMSVVWNDAIALNGLGVMASFDSVTATTAAPTVCVSFVDSHPTADVYAAFTGGTASSSSSASSSTLTARDATVRVAAVARGIPGAWLVPQVRCLSDRDAGN